MTNKSKDSILRKDRFKEYDNQCKLMSRCTLKWYDITLLDILNKIRRK